MGGESDGDTGKETETYRAVAMIIALDRFRGIEITRFTMSGGC
jgi:hypothetical protein